MSSEIPLPRKKLSSDNAKFYKSLGSLIKEYRKWREISQEAFAELIKISVRELQNWEANRRRVRIENLHDLSECTGIPMQALVALNADQPIWYSLRKRFFTYSLIEKAQFSSKELFVSSKKPEDPNLIKTATITTEKHMDMILSCHQDLYGTKTMLKKDIIKTATDIVPDLNIIIFDYWGHYVAHRICLPINIDIYQELKGQKVLENYLTKEMISDIIKLEEGVFFLYSTFSSNINTAYRLISGDIRVLSRIKHKERYILASHTITKESSIIQNNLNMTFVRDFSHANDEVFPVIYESKLDFLLRPDGPFGWLIEPSAEKKLSENPNTNSRRKKSAEISKKNTDTFSYPDKSFSPETTPENEFPLIVDNFPSIVDTRIHNKQNRNDLCNNPKIEACSNPKCIFYGKTEKGNIVSNGTYRTKKGTPGRRFLCKECGKSFCSRTKTIFYDLRSSEEKVFNAIKLLVKGMPVHRVAKSLGAKPDTIRHWLQIASSHSDKIDTMLINEKDISQNDLDLLWTFVRTNSLHKRASLYRTKNKSNII